MNANNYDGQPQTYQKRYRKDVRKMISNMNRVLKKDPLFLGRFFICQTRSQFDRFPDNSGGMLIVFIRVFDKKTGHYKDYKYEYAPWLISRYWFFDVEIVNNFIIEVSDFWHEEPYHTIHNAEDFKDIKIPEKYLHPKNDELCFYQRGKIKC